MKNNKSPVSLTDSRSLIPKDLDYGDKEAVEKTELLLQIKEMAAKSEVERKTIRKALKELRKTVEVLEEFFDNEDGKRIIYRTCPDSTLHVAEKK